MQDTLDKSPRASNGENKRHKTMSMTLKNMFKPTKHERVDDLEDTNLNRKSKEPKHEIHFSIGIQSKLARCPCIAQVLQQICVNHTCVYKICITFNACVIHNIIITHCILRSIIFI